MTMGGTVLAAAVSAAIPSWSVHVGTPGAGIVALRLEDPFFPTLRVGG